MPKFFIHLGTKMNEAESVFYSSVHGPFESDIDVKAYLSKHWPNDKGARFILFEGAICGVPASRLEKPEDEKRAPGDENNWVRHSNGSWYCKACGALIMSAQVAHPIHDGPFEGAGGGRCEYESVGYCPNCEKKPDFHGAPIRVPS